MDIIFEQYIERLKRKRKSPHTIQTFMRAAGRLETWLSTTPYTASTVPYPVLEDYFDGLELSPSSIAVELRYVQAAYNYAAKRGIIRDNPAILVEPPNVPQKEPRTIPTSCLRFIRDGIYRTRDWVWFHVLAYTGMRRSEARGLRWDDGGEGSVLRLEQQTIRVLGKGGKMRYVPVHPALGEVLAGHRTEPGSFVVPSTGSKGVALETIQDMSRRLHPVYTPHDYRRTVATSLRRNGVDVSVIDRIMGWAPRSVFRRHYDDVADTELQRAILKLYADDPI